MSFPHALESCLDLAPLDFMRRARLYDGHGQAGRRAWCICAGLTDGISTAVHHWGFARLTVVFVLHQRPRYPVVNLLPFACFKSEFLAGLQKRPDLLQAQPLSVL